VLRCALFHRVDNFNPWSKNGRFIARAPFSSGAFELFGGIRSTYVSTPLTAFYNQWNHFAIVHDQAAGM
jgi:hypothetical protein